MNDRQAAFTARETKRMALDKKRSHEAKVTGESYVPQVEGVKMRHFDLNDPEQAREYMALVKARKSAQ